MTREPFFVRDDDPPAKREILKAALAAFVRNGVSSTTIRNIASDSGYTNPALFKHFATKDELALYLFERCFERLSSDVQRAIHSGRAFGANLGAVLAQLGRLLDEDLDAFLYVHEELRRQWPNVSPDLRRRSIVAMLRSLLEQGRREKVVSRAQSLELQVTAFIGIMAQFGRALYFGELSGSAVAALPDLETLISKMLAP